MTYFAKKGIVYNGRGEVVLVVTPVNCSKQFTRSYAKVMADELNDEDYCMERSELCGACE